MGVVFAIKNTNNPNANAPPTVMRRGTRRGGGGQPSSSTGGCDDGTSGDGVGDDGWSSVLPLCVDPSVSTPWYLVWVVISIWRP
jgi:hypothetical protein